MTAIHVNDDCVLQTIRCGNGNALLFWVFSWKWVKSKHEESNNFTCTMSCFQYLPGFLPTYYSTSNFRWTCNGQSKFIHELACVMRSIWFKRPVENQVSATSHYLVHRQESGFTSKDHITRQVAHSLFSHIPELLSPSSITALKEGCWTGFTQKHTTQKVKCWLNFLSSDSVLNAQTRR